MDGFPSPLKIRVTSRFKSDTRPQVLSFLNPGAQVVKWSTQMASAILLQGKFLLVQDHALGRQVSWSYCILPSSPNYLPPLESNTEPISTNQVGCINLIPPCDPMINTDLEVFPGRFTPAADPHMGGVGLHACRSTWLLLPQGWRITAQNPP